jgi:hypothetical protein
MLNKKLNLLLKLNNSPMMVDQPFTPLEQTVHTPLDHPPAGGPHNISQPPSDYFRQTGPQAPHNGDGGPQQPPTSLYRHPSYNELDDILTDIDEPLFGSYKTTKSYTVTFTPLFDQLLYGVYQHFLSLPMTTPFLGHIPPSGLASKIANETFSRLVASTQQPHPPYDAHNIVLAELLRTPLYRPVFLQLFRKRLLDLCGHHSGGAPGVLPQQTSVTTTVTSGIGPNGGMHATGGVVSNNGKRESSISNLLLTELNISSYNRANGVQAAAPAAPPPAGAGFGLDSRSRSSSLLLRKQSLTRNNLYSGNNWLHVGNLSTIKPEHSKYEPAHDNLSVDLLQLIQDYVPQSFINKLAPQGAPHAPSGPHSSAGAGLALALASGFNSMMMDYHTPPNSQKGSILHQITPPSNQLYNAGSESLVDDFTFYDTRSRSLSRGTTLPRALQINTDNANGAARTAAANALSGGEAMDTLDSPFMSATTPLDDCGYFSNGFGQQSGSVTQLPVEDTLSSAAPKPSAQATNVPLGPPVASMTPQVSPGGTGARESINIPGLFTLSEKKRDSLKLKRGIH